MKTEALSRIQDLAWFVRNLGDEPTREVVRNAIQEVIDGLGAIQLQLNQIKQRLQSLEWSIDGRKSDLSRAWDEESEKQDCQHLWSESRYGKTCVKCRKRVRFSNEA